MSTDTTDPAESVLDALRNFQNQIIELDQFITGLKENQKQSVAEASEIFFHLDFFKTQISVLLKQAEQNLIALMQDEEAVQVSAGEMLVKEWSKNRKSWRHKEIGVAVAERIQLSAVDMDTGERTMTVQQMIEAMLDYVQPAYWRVTALKEIGLNADSFCETSDPEPRIKIERLK